MRLIYLHILAVAVAVLTLAACDKEDTEPSTGNVAPIFTATIEGGHSRVVGCDWEPGDEIGISAYVSSINNSVYNVCHLAPNGNNEITVKNIEEQIYYKSATRTAEVTFSAYYPYIYIANPNTASNRLINIDTSNQKMQKSFDFLFASVKGSKESPIVNFEFTHKMSKVTFVFKSGNSFNVSDITAYRLGELYMGGKFNITSGAFTSLSGKSVVQMDLTEVGVKDGEPVTPLILIPQTVSSTSVRLEIVSSDNQIYAVNLTFPKNVLVAGNNYKFTVTVNKTGLTVSNCTIENWITKEDTGWGSGAAGSADDPEEN